MQKVRVLLVCSHHLFGESIESILRMEEALDLIGPWSLGDQNICQKVGEMHLSVVVIADDELQSEAAASLTDAILEKYPDLTVIRAGLSENVFRIFSTHTLPARGTNLIEAIHSLPAWEQKSVDAENHKSTEV